VAQLSTAEGVRAQVEGGLLFGLSAAVWGEVELGDGADQHDDPLQRLDAADEEQHRHVGVEIG